MHQQQKQQQLLTSSINLPSTSSVNQPNAISTSGSNGTNLPATFIDHISQHNQVSRKV